MSDAQSRLDAYWAATEAPAQDFAFVLAVEERIARTRMVRDLAAQLTGGSVLIAAAVAAWPALTLRADALVSSLDAAGPALAAVCVLGAAMAWLTREPAEA